MSDPATDLADDLESLADKLTRRAHVFSGLEGQSVTKTLTAIAEVAGAASQVLRERTEKEKE
jgi:hypothetical protein